MAVRKKKTADRWKTKKWYTLLAPKCFEEKEIGQTVASEPKQIVGRIIRTPLNVITGNISQQSMILKFRVVDVKGEYGKTAIAGHEIQRGYMERLVRRMHSIVTAIGPVTTKDGYTLQITSVAIARNKMASTQRKAIRKVMYDYIKTKASKMKLDKFFQEMIFGKVSSEIAKEIKKIYPVSRVEIKKSRIISEPGKKSE
ncbi:MAG: 30S ribosomal protein S3ae [Candidatus Diapherotrites archaeon]|nr:30S ribosomal protein S3ae [Candidatus Diapherotrites archaeon]